MGSNESSQRGESSRVPVAPRIVNSLQLLRGVPVSELEARLEGLRVMMGDESFGRFVRTMERLSEIVDSDQCQRPGIPTEGQARS